MERMRTYGAIEPHQINMNKARFKDENIKTRFLYYSCNAYFDFFTDKDVNSIILRINGIN